MFGKRNIGESNATSKISTCELTEIFEFAVGGKAEWGSKTRSIFCPTIIDLYLLQDLKQWS
jgi:hypothetical protein